MNPTPPSPTKASSADATGPPTLRSLVGRLAAAMAGPMSPGDVAALRRLDPHDPSNSAFWRIAGEVLRPTGFLPDGPGADAAERRWAVILQAMATLSGLHRPGRKLGAALVEAGFSELRFSRLLRADGDALADEVRTAAAFLAAKAEPVDLADLAELVLTTKPDRVEALRRRLARGYYDKQFAKTKETS